MSNSGQFVEELDLASLHSNETSVRRPQLRISPKEASGLAHDIVSPLSGDEAVVLDLGVSTPKDSLESAASSALLLPKPRGPRFRLFPVWLWVCQHWWVPVIAALVIVVIAVLAVAGQRGHTATPAATLRFFARLRPEERRRYIQLLAAEYMEPKTAPQTRVFPGMAYLPRGSLEPLCGVNYTEVVADVARLATYTDTLRTYGTQCNQTRYVLQAIRELDVDVGVALGVWLGPDEALNQAQIEEMARVVTDYPAMVRAVYVGHEVLWRGDMPEERLLRVIRRVKIVLKLINSAIPVGTAEAATHVSERLLEECDVVAVDIHPFLAGVAAQDAAEWLLDLVSRLVDSKNASGTKIVIAEVGWPTGGGSYKSAVASVAEAQRFLNLWMCQWAPALEGVYSWYYFEAFDEPWKRIYYRDNDRWETEWGLFGVDRQMKGNMTLPQCR